jgi:hypothetical protein
MVLVGKIFEKFGLSSGTSLDISPRAQQVLTTLAGLHVQGRTSFAEVAQFHHDPLFHKSLNLPTVFAPETIRLYLEQIVRTAKQNTHAFLDQVNLNLLDTVEFTPIRSTYGTYIPVDIDVSPMDNSKTHKEGVSRTYKGHDGYAPIFSYIGVEGYMLDQELRPGSQHCQKDTPEYLERNLQKLKALSFTHPLLFRLDSGNDAFDTLKILMESPHYFLVKRNLRRESRERWQDLALAMGNCTTPRSGKSVYTGVLTAAHPKAVEESKLPQLDQVFQVTIRTTDHQGVPYLVPDVEVDVYWTNLYENPETIIGLYHDHGTSEQFHSELKTDMNVERFPSGKLAVNTLLLHIAMIAFNTLRMIGQTALQFAQDLPYRHKGKRKRLRKVIDDLIRISCKLVLHARKFKVKLWCHDPWYAVFRSTYLAL